MNKIYFILLVSFIFFSCQKELIAPLPVVITGTTTFITTTTALSGGNVTAYGFGAVTARGVCWSTNENPVVTDDHTTDSSGLGIFSSAITGLSEYTTYHVRAYATSRQALHMVLILLLKHYQL